MTRTRQDEDPLVAEEPITNGYVYFEFAHKITRLIFIVDTLWGSPYTHPKNSFCASNLVALHDRNRQTANIDTIFTLTLHAKRMLAYNMV